MELTRKKTIIKKNTREVRNKVKEEKNKAWEVRCNGIEAYIGRAYICRLELDDNF